ncbi:hypothetical protein J6590_013550 [Homalodisca vitripennis]|nr:hypothetical protein J6590_013550 [Homalodisca vitripennis]
MPTEDTRFRHRTGAGLCDLTTRTTEPIHVEGRSEKKCEHCSSRTTSSEGLFTADYWITLRSFQTISLSVCLSVDDMKLGTYSKLLFFQEGNQLNMS